MGKSYDHVMHLVYESSVNEIVPLNSTFDKGVLRIAYHGKNRNKSFISKETFEKCIDTIYNCPVVCNYDSENETIGAHDIAFVGEGADRHIVNITEPIGVVPESARHWWETVEEDNGTIHEYLCADFLLWKRQQAYRHIKENGITSESMEIGVQSGKTIDGYYHIDSFEFQAFCLLESAEPCFESACIEIFSLDNFKEQYTQMMGDFKEAFSKITSSVFEGDIKTTLLKGGKTELNKIDLLKEFGLTPGDLDFDINDYSIDELREKLAAFADDEAADEENDAGAGEDGATSDESNDATGDDDDAEDTDSDSDTPADEGDDGDDDDDTAKKQYSLTAEEVREGLVDVLIKVMYMDAEWGEMHRYYYVDYDPIALEVFFQDAVDWKLYGCKYAMNGDNVLIDFESKKRKRVEIVDFNEGDPDFSMSSSFAIFGKDVITNKTAKYAVALNEAETELQALREYKNAKEDEERKAAEDAVFSQFADLDGIEAFEKLRASCAEMSIEDIENKCYEIKGRTVQSKFALNKQPTKIIVEKTNADENEPYHGLFLKHNINN